MPAKGDRLPFLLAFAASIQTSNENQHFFLEASSRQREEQDKQEGGWRSTGTPCWVAVHQPLRPRVRRVDLAFFRRARCFKHPRRQQPQQLLRQQMLPIQNFRHNTQTSTHNGKASCTKYCMTVVLFLPALLTRNF